jgi:predicted transcriptional regulator
MSDGKALIDQLDQPFGDILDIVKALGNEKRLQILITLLSGPKSFEGLKNETDLKKTALSNHLAIMMQQELIKKPEHGKYEPTSDGKLFLQAIEVAYNKSDRWKKNQINRQMHQSSNSFIDALFTQGP